MCRSDEEKNRNVFSRFWRLVGKNALVGTKDWTYFEQSAETEEKRLAKASLELTTHIGDRIDSGEADIYEVYSVLRRGGDLLRSLGEKQVQDPSEKSLRYTLFKCLVCAGIQTVVAPLVVISKVYETLSDDSIEICQHHWKDDWIGKIVACAFAWYVFVQFLKAMRNVTDEKNAATYLICTKSKIPVALGASYLWGYTVNLISECYTALASLFLIFLAPNPLDMVLNSLAILFLNELDDNVASDKDLRVAKSIVERLKWIDEEGSESDCEKEENKESRALLTSQLRDVKCSYWIFKWHISLLTFAGYIFVTVGPFFMLICYGSAGKEGD